MLAGILDDSEKRLNSPVLGFSLGSAGRQVRFSEVAGARLRLQYRRAARQPAGRPVWRTLYPGERPAAVPGTAVCAYWSEHDLEWRTDGCQLMGSSSSDHATCSCSHLTNFAILMDYHEYVGTPLSLSVLTWLLGTLSVICLILTWVVFTFTSPPPDVPTAVRSLRCCRTTITRHLCATYAAGLVLLLTVMDRHLVYLEPIACSLAGMAIHYCFLSVFAWSMVEGVHLYKVLRHVFEPKSNSMTRYYMYGYLGPALIVIVTNTVALGTDQYAYVRDEFCWLKVPYFIWFFNGPLAVVLIMNMLVVVLAFRSAASLKVNQLRAKKERIKRWLKGWFCLSCLLGVQWTVGYLLVDGSNVFDYVFTVLNCSQGILIFVFHCLLRSRTRQILLGRFNTAKSSTMMNSVYGQMVLAQQKSQQCRQTRQSLDTSITTLSSQPAGISSDSESSPASARSRSSDESGSRRRSRPTSGRHLSRQRQATDGQPTGTQRGRVNPAFEPEEPWTPLPDISEEAEQTSPRRGQLRTRLSERAGRLPAAWRPDGAEMYRSHSVGHLRHGRRVR
ncbi:adhesion G protein-coupled receptor L1-like [Pollicipes pollicipes]|uniref:adhesion G protein-coupled receptor L1-like n=1 Tax=Pollicipes pollicipes TaxID=41117 RepID=UPI00188581EC|nr:adhesion G protein-coupled receptor L1-like [Pollicipes pollicipes]